MPPAKGTGLFKVRSGELHRKWGKIKEGDEWAEKIGWKTKCRDNVQRRFMRILWLPDCKKLPGGENRDRGPGANV